MHETHSTGSAASRAPTLRAGRWATAILVLATFVVVADARAESPGVRMRRARFALARGADDRAAADLEAVRRSEPGSARGLEAALLLADLHFTAARMAEADTVLAEAAREAPTSIVAPIDLARAWLALGRGDTTTALRGFDRVRRSEISLARDVAEIGSGWSALVAGEPLRDVSRLRAISRGDGGLALRFGASWTLARTYAAAGEHQRGLRALRALRREVRGTSYEDDLELMLGLAQLDAGRARDALRTLRRLQRRHGQGAARAPIDTGLRLVDLRADDAALVARVGALYAARTTRSVGLLNFLAALLDRSAAADAASAIALAERAVATKGDDR